MFVAIKDNFCNEKVIVKRIRRGFFVCLTVERQVQFNLLNLETSWLPDYGKFWITGILKHHA